MNIFKERNLGPFSFLVIYQFLTLIALPFYLWYGLAQLSTFIWAFVLYFAGGLAITSGYHRLFSHRTYKAHWIVQAIVTFMGSTTLQGSVIRWSYDHRMHHAHVDTDLDPYTIKKGFLYAHMLWLFDKPRTIERKVVADLYNNPLVAWQHRHDLLAMMGSNVIVWAICGFFTGDYLGAFFLAVCLRLFFLHHCTWFINSLAHTWGDQPFSKEHTAVNNYIISLLTFGEGYHNFHHTYANDYRNGVKWYQFDPSKWIIWSLEKIGLVRGLKRVDEFAIHKKILSETTNEIYETLSKSWCLKKEALVGKVEELTSALEEKISQLQTLKNDRVSLKRELRKFNAEWKRYLKLARKIHKFASDEIKLQKSCHSAAAY